MDGQRQMKVYLTWPQTRCDGKKLKKKIQQTSNFNLFAHKQEKYVIHLTLDNIQAGKVCHSFSFGQYTSRKSMSFI